MATVTRVVLDTNVLVAAADDTEDDKRVSAALATGAILVTNDAHLLAFAGHDGLKVLRPTCEHVDVGRGDDIRPNRATAAMACREPVADSTATHPRR
jgi:hypothetical protein